MFGITLEAFRSIAAYGPDSMIHCGQRSSVHWGEAGPERRPAEQPGYIKQGIRGLFA